jgi:hypothetical protein
VKTQRSALRSVAFGLIATLLTVGLVGCGVAGAAAKVGPNRISDEQLNTDVSALFVAQGRAADTQDSTLIRSVLERAVVFELIDQLADREGVTVPPGDVEALTAEYVRQFGGVEDFEAAVLQQGVPPEQINDFLILNLQVEQLRERQTGDNPDAAFADLLLGFADEVGVDISPRYGTWVPEALTIAPPADTLSTPAPN